ncbi:MAG: hypothetical protein WC755_04780 [Candidatus Woesearchaeota archaeon]|jgi:hypothetical protein
MDKNIESLARLLTADVKLYAAGRRYLESVQNQGVFSEGLEKEISKHFEIMEKAYQISSNGRIYIFQTEDTWASEGREQEWYHLFKKVGDRFVALSRGDRPSFSNEIVNYLKKDKISEIYTFSNVEQYDDLKKSIDEGDGHSISYEKANQDQIREFSGKGIRIIDEDSIN